MSYCDNERKIMFVHIPKTGGTSIESIIGGGGHSSINDVFHNRKSEVNQWMFVAMVRNPYERLVSAWAHCRQFKDQPFSPNETFDQYIENLPERLWQVHLRPQYSFLMFQGTVRGSFVGDYENFQEDAQRILNYFGHPTVEISHKRKLEYGDWRDYYKQKHVDIVRRCYKKDFEEFLLPVDILP